MTTNRSVARVAESIAWQYLHFLKSMNPNHRPWNPNQNPRETKYWKHWLDAAKTVMELKVSPRNYVAAQFESYSRWAKSKFPFPQQIASDYARLRYIEWAERQNARNAKLNSDAKQVIDVSAYEEKKLQAMARRFELGEQKVLLMCPLEFSEALHTRHGTWTRVADKFES